MVHFFQKPPPPASVDWATGLVTLGKMLRGLADWPSLVPGFFNLWIAGMILGWAYERRGNLAAAVGLHAGWIFWLKSYAHLTRPAATTHPALWGTGKLIDGLLATLVLLLTAAWIGGVGRSEPGRRGGGKGAPLE
jgi:membrane protease YdiL (CAAX protease family)